MVLLRLAIVDGAGPTYAALATELGISVSEVHAAIERSMQAQLAFKDESGRPAVMRAALKRFVLFGARYSFPATRGGMTRGMPTAHAAPPLLGRIVQSGDPPPVWPDPHGAVRGQAFFPLYPSSAKACASNVRLYELLALFDALRGGSLREQTLATELLEESLG